MSTHDSLDILYERAKGKLTLREWETLFNNVCDTIMAGETFSFGYIPQHGNEGDMLFSFEEALDRVNSGGMADVKMNTLEARSETIRTIKKQLGKITPDEVSQEKEGKKSLVDKFRDFRQRR